MRFLYFVLQKYVPSLSIGAHKLYTKFKLKKKVYLNISF